MSQFKRSLGLVDATMIVSGSMIGSGIFIVTSQMARDVGSSGYILLLWILTGVITLAAALCYGELAGMMPQAGGQYVYIRKAYNPFMAFLYGWTVFSVIQTGVIAAVAVAFAKYAGVFFPILNNTIIQTNFISITYAQFVAIGSICFLSYTNSRGIKNGKIVQLIFTSAKLIALFGLIIIGLFIGFKTDTLSQNFNNAWDAKQFFQNANGEWISQGLTGVALLGMLGSTIINPLFSSDAWNNVTFIAGEIKNPEKNIARSLILGTFIVTVLYCLSNLAYLALLPLNGNSVSTEINELGISFAPFDRVGTSAAYVIFGSSAVLIMAALIMISTFGCNNGLILSGSRLFYAMANDGLFFKKAATLNKNDVPGFAIVIQCIWASALCLSGKYGMLLEYATFASLLFYVITIIGIFILRKKEPNANRPYKVWLYPVLPIVYIIITGLICLDLLYYKPESAGLGLLIVLLGIPIYFLVKPKKNINPDLTAS